MSGSKHLNPRSRATYEIVPATSDHGTAHRGERFGSERAYLDSVMYPFRKILFPVDYSNHCDAVVPYIKDMVERFSADLTLVHAYEPEALAYDELGVVITELDHEARDRQDRRLREFALATFPGKHVDCLAELGEPGVVIDRIVQHQGADLVMLPTHGRGVIRRFLLGSVVAKVLHDVSAAVWTGTGSALKEHTLDLPYKSILCAVDNSDEAEIVLKAAAALSCTYRAELWIVHVVPTPPGTLEVDYSEYRRDILDAADFRLYELKTQLGINAPHAILDAAVAGGVREEAIRRKADIIITGRGYAQTRFERFWSSLYPIIRESPCPVLSI